MPGAAGFVYADVPNRVIALIIDVVVLVIISIAVFAVLGIVGLSAGLISTGGTNPVASIVAATAAATSGLPEKVEV